MLHDTQIVDKDCLVVVGRAGSGKSFIVSHGSRDAVDVVRRSQQNGEFENAEWLSGRILEAEDAFLASTAEIRPPRRLLELILKDYFHLIQRDADLFELVCQILDDINETFRKASGVAGFCEPVMPGEKAYCEPEDKGHTYVQKPKSEDLCQNVLWVHIHPRLKAYGVTQVEEDVVGPDYADLRIEYVVRVCRTR